jgi:glycerophosphoryl diester phosphodiesterase
MERPRRFERIGHRGAPRELAENTLASIARALERRAEALELDVHATSDGVVVVHHDPAVGSAAQPDAMRGALIVQTSWPKLRDVEVAPKGHIPSLAEVLAAVDGRATVYVEIKGRDIERLVADVIVQSDCSCAVHSFDHAAIERMYEIAPEIPRGLLFDRYPADVADAMKRAGARDVWPNWTLIDRSLVDAVHGARGRTIAWTVNDADVADRLAELGVDGICSDDLRRIG